MEQKEAFAAMLDALDCVYKFMDDNSYLPTGEGDCGVMTFTRKEYMEILDKIDSAVYLAAPELFVQEK